MKSSQKCFQIAVFVLALASGCRETPERLGERETLAYKRELLSESHGSLTRAQQHRFMMHPARTREELDEALEQFLEETERRRSYERARLLREKEEAERREEGEPES